MNLNNKKDLAALCGTVVLVIVALALLFTRNEAEEPSAAAESSSALAEYRTVIETQYVEKLVRVEVEKEITTSILKEKLEKVGRLVCAEYLFSEITEFKTSKTFAWILHADSQLVMGYEGVVSAGVDFTGVRVAKNEMLRTVTVTLPDPEILYVTLDNDSFKVYVEDVSKFNIISAEDYNGSIAELKEKAQKRALERGILDQARAHAQSIVTGIVGGLVDLEEYSLEFVSP